MREPLKYSDGTPILVSDRVEIRRRFRRAIAGTVDYVYDPSRPEEREVNDYGFEVRLDNGVSRYYLGRPGTEVILLRRGATG